MAAEVYNIEGKLRRCFICHETGADRAHIKTKGSGGPMDDWNIILFCRSHHVEQHTVGWIRMCQKYPIVQTELMRRGIKINHMLGKLIWPAPPDDVA